MLLIELAIGAPGILVAATAIVMRRRRSSDQPRMPAIQRVPATERAPAIQRVPATEHAPAIQRVPVPEHAPAIQRVPVPEHMPVTQRADRPVPRRKASVMPGPGHDAGRRDPCAHVRAEPERAAQAQVSAAGPEPDRQQSASGAVTRRDRIATYYDEADRPMADYLEAQGWIEEPGAHHPW
jgi:hypothetical protein